ncbi:MAG: hypothetical protein ABJE80_21255 [Reichenbachiella sp.]|uniref:hypothetical protein n=2 Tax=Reichenbachiella sp. TaxID=2184521 RepID=UPI003262D6CD
MATLDKSILFIGFLLFFLLVQCGTADISKSFQSEQANRLLSADATKSWALFSRTVDGGDVFGPCLENNTLTFVKAAVGDSLYQLGRLITCGSTSTVDTLYKAKYALEADTDEVFQNSIALTEEKHLTIGTLVVEEITSSNLSISYTIDGQTVQEQYAH